MKTRILFFAFLFLPALGKPCSCLYFLSFCETVNEDSEVISGEIFHAFVHGGAHYINVEILQTIQGESTFDTLTLQTGLLLLSCSPSPTDFRLGDTIVVNLNQMIYSPPSPYPTYGLSLLCSNNYQLVLNGQIFLPNVFDSDSTTYEDFLKDFSTCTAKKPKIDLETSIRIFPIPTTTELFISLSGYTDLDYQIFSPDGKLVLASSTADKAVARVDVSNFAAGLYFIRFQTDEEQRVERFIVN